MSPEADDRTRTAPPRDATTVSGVFDPPTAPPDPPAHSPPTASSQVPGYEITGELGRGGMGVVYRAIHLSLGRPIALKMVLGEGAADSPEGLRFLAEAAAVAAVTHPHVVGVYDYGRANGLPYLALELCGKGTLAQRLKAAGRFDPRAAAELVAKIAEGVGAAHAAGIVHRDLKPGNVLFDDRNEPKVSDFGLAKRAGSDLTQTNAVMGTPAYMSPEQAKGDTKFVGPPADVWALGVMLYECLTGKRPFAATDQMALLHQVMYADPPTVRSLNKSLAPDLDQIVRKCLSKAPHERYATANELAADLRNWLGGRPVSARPPGPLVRVVKWVRRNPLPTALMASLTAVVVAVAAGAYVSIQQLQRANQAQADKLTAEEGQRAADEQKRVTAVQSAMRLALQRGVATRAVAAFDEFVAGGQTPTAEMRLDRAKAAYFLGETEDAKSRLQEIDRDQLPKGRRGEAELLRGLLLLGPNDAAGLDAIRTARTFGLSDADDAFAAGMVADSTAEALTHFRDAYRIDPAHIDGRVMAAVALTLLARYDEAETLIEQTRPLAPDHPHLPVIGVIVAGMSGNRAKADELLAVFADRVRDPKLKGAVPVVAELFGILPEVRQHFEGVLSGDQSAFAKMMMKIGPNTANAKKVETVVAAGIFPRSLSDGLPPCFRADLTFFISECLSGGAKSLLATVFNRWLPGVGTYETVFAFTDRKGQEAAKKVLARFPEGTMKWMYAMQMFLNAQDRPKAFGPRAAAVWDEAADALEDAARSPGHIVPREFLLEYAAVAMNMAVILDRNDPARPQRQRRIVRLVEQRLALPSAPSWEAFHKLAVAVIEAGNPDAARWVLGKWGETLTKTDREYQQQRVMAEITNRRFGAALDELSRIDPADEPARSLNNLCRRRLGMRELLPPPRKAE